MILNVFILKPELGIFDGSLKVGAGAVNSGELLKGRGE